MDFLQYKPTVLSPLHVGGSLIERVSSHKLLGVIITQNLSWNEHSDYTYSKANKRLFGLRVLKKRGLRPPDLVEVYCSIIRSVLEYASPVSAGLPVYLSDLLGSTQRKALRITYTHVPYHEALQLANLDSLSSRRTIACRNFVKNCIKTGTLSGIFRQPTKNQHQYNLRSGQSHTPSVGKTDRMSRFITVNHQFL